MKQTLLFLGFSLSSFVWGASSLPEAEQVIKRFSDNKIPVELSLSLEAKEGRDVFESSVEKGVLKIKGSSGVALCRGFYDYVKESQKGIFSWSGKRLESRGALAPQAKKRVESPFVHRYYFNVVTFGYTTPYWDWPRWEKEIDWMALHGINMPLCLVANEAISARVWKKLGLTDEEIAAYFVGPAHFPWMRMGNISGIDGPLPASWHEDQVALQHKILTRARALGMKPICPGFAGFVPPAMSRVFPEIKLIQTSWSGGAFHNWMLSPDQPLFAKIGQMFIEEWEKEFGKNDYYLVDSFNEMEIPFPPKGTEERTRLLTQYGKAVYGSIKAGNPEATWVMQGWMFGYQRSIWDPETLKALVSPVPDDKMLLLDLAVDYNALFWRNGFNWDFYQGFFNKPWVYSVIPNMGGKSGMTGSLEFYANGRLQALNSPHRGMLTGYGMAPEGIENNEVLYELIADGAWSTDKIEVEEWLKNYSLCRYGAAPREVMDFWQGLQKSVYGGLTDHPRYNWQFRPGSVQKGSIQATEPFYAGIEALAQAAPALKDSPLFVSDLVEMTAHYTGAKLEILIQAILQAYGEGQEEKAVALEKEFARLALEMDSLLSTHPFLRLESWLAFARGHGETTAFQDYYERNARRLVTIWGPPVDDYSARLWSGLIRDYYVPRWQLYFESKRTGKPCDLAAWERHWVEKKTGLSKVAPLKNRVQACLALLEKSQKVTGALLSSAAENELGSWSKNELSTEWKELSWQLPVEKLPLLKGVRFQFQRGAHKLMISAVSVEMDGKEVCRVEQEGEAGLEHKGHIYRLAIPKEATGNNSCTLRARVKSDHSCDSFGKVHLLLHSEQKGTPKAP